MAYLYQEITKVPGLSGTGFDRQKQLYEKLGAPQGSYTGSLSQNTYLLQQIAKGNYGAAAPAAQPQSNPAQPANAPAAPLPANDPSFDAQDMAKANTQADAQINPGVRDAQAGLANEQNVAKTNAQNLTDQLAEVYRQRKLQDPLAKQGIVSGAALNYTTDQQAKGVQQVGSDLGNKLSDIAQRLTNTTLNAADKKTTLVNQLADQSKQNRYVAEDRTIAAQNTQYAKDQAAKQSQQSVVNLLGIKGIDSLNNDFLTQLLKSFGYDVTP